MGEPFHFGRLEATRDDRSGTCTRGLRTCNAERVTLTNSDSSPRVCLALNEHSGKAAITGSPYCIRWARRCMSRPDPKSRRFPCNKKRLTSPPSLESIGQIGNTISAFTCPVHPHVIIFPVNPTMLAKYRRAFVPSGAKDDPSDAALALDLLLRHPERLARLKRESEDMRALRRLVQARRDLVQDRVRVTNRLTFTLKEYFPQIVEWFRDKETDVFAAFLERWPSLQAVQRARRETIVAFFHAHNVRRASVIDRRIGWIESERPLTTDSAVIEPALAVVTTLLPQLRALSAGVARLDADIAKRCQALPDFRLFAPLPGAGPVFASRLLAGFGENRQRFADAAA